MMDRWVKVQKVQKSVEGGKEIEYTSISCPDCGRSPADSLTKGAFCAYCGAYNGGTEPQKDLTNYEMFRRMSKKQIAKFLLDTDVCSFCSHYDVNSGICTAKFTFNCTAEYQESVMEDYLNESSIDLDTDTDNE